MLRSRYARLTRRMVAFYNPFIRSCGTLMLKLAVSYMKINKKFKAGISKR